MDFTHDPYFAAALGNASIQVTSGVTPLAPVGWLRARPAVALGLAGVVAWVVFKSSSVGIALLAAAAGLWLLEATAPPPASTVTLGYGGNTLSVPLQ